MSKKHRNAHGRSRDAPAAQTRETTIGGTSFLCSNAAWALEAIRQGMTLPYPCDAEVCLGLQDSVEETVEEYCDVAESKQITESESKSKCRT